MSYHRCYAVVCRVCVGVRVVDSSSRRAIEKKRFRRERPCKSEESLCKPSIFLLLFFDIFVIPPHFSLNPQVQAANCS